MSYTAEELKEMIERGEDQTDWARVDAMTEEELEASIDVEEEGIPDYSTVYFGFPPRKQAQVWIDEDLAEWFKAPGINYHERISEVLRRYVEAQKQAESAQQDAEDHGQAADAQQPNTHRESA